jgi:predicted secreted protein
VPLLIELTSGSSDVTIRRSEQVRMEMKRRQLLTIHAGRPTGRLSTQDSMNIKPNVAACITAALLLLGSVAAGAQPAAFAPLPQNVLQLSASGTVEVLQDMLTMNLTTTREGSDSNAVQGQLKAALEAALAEARKAASPGQMEVRTGNFSLSPRYGRDGRITAWNGTAELVLEGRDFARIAQTAGRIQAMTVANASFGLSREQRTKVEADAQAIAIDRFKAKAGEIAKGFGFAGYGLREIAVNANDQGFTPRAPRLMAATASASQEPVPVEAGRSAVTVTVSGTVQLK